jgi:hypothetical protein
MPKSKEHIAILLFQFLCSKYIQHQDQRQKDMLLQYMEAETHDLAKELSIFITEEIC